MNRLPFVLALVLGMAVPSSPAQEGGDSDESSGEEGPAIETEGPAQLLERGRAAFAEKRFAEAEQALEKFIADYGEAEEAKEAVRIHRPLVAICKVSLRKFGEALEWIERSLKDPELKRSLADELRFWRGICLMTQGELVEAQRAFGEYWAEEPHTASKRYEALLLFAALYIRQDFPAVAADFLAEQRPKIREAAPEAASRAAVLELHARLVAGQRRRALELIRSEYPRLSEMTQLVTFQTLALQLGSGFLEEERWYDAITCLQRLWSSDRLLEHQNGKIAMIEDHIAQLEQRPNTRGTVFQLRAILKRVRRELGRFRSIENFDSALRLRLATAFQGLGRYREAALIMEAMLENMPPGPVVESATLTQLQCWMQIERWPKSVETADRYAEVFGDKGENLPTVLFLKAEALREDERRGAARLAYAELVERFPEGPFAPKAVFMQGFLYLQEDDNDGALYQFDQVGRKYPDSDMVEDADYWTGMAHSFAGRYEEARTHLRGYLERHDTPKYRKEATFRIAVCTFSLAEYDAALGLLRAFNERYPGDPLTDEANLLIGDAHLADGEMEKGFAAYDRVRPQSGRYFEEAWFKKGEAYKRLEEYGTMREHFTAFVEQYPESARMPEAVYWIGWTHLEAGDPEEARDIYWETIEEHGNDPEMATLIDVLTGLPKVYGGTGDAGTEELLTRLQLAETRASVAGETTLALRAGWALSRALASSNPTAARTELLAIAEQVDPEKHSPRIAVDVGEALLAAGNPLTARELLADVRRWHPRTVQKGRIYRALGEIAAGEEDWQKALEYYEKFEREAVASVDIGAVKREKAGILERLGRPAEARAELEAVLESEKVPAESKAEALLALGRSHAEEGRHEKAIVYFERVYVAYGKFAEANARAYRARGESLEALGLEREALETYEELVSRDALSRFDAVDGAEQRIAALRPRVSPSASAASTERKSGVARSGEDEPTKRANAAPQPKEDGP